jgi:hypothetical protein
MKLQIRLKVITKTNNDKIIPKILRSLFLKTAILGFNLSVLESYLKKKETK